MSAKHICCGCNDEEVFRAGERSGNPADGWIGEREEIVLKASSGLGYHFLVPKPLAEHTQDLRACEEALRRLLEGMEASGGWEGDDELFDNAMRAITKVEGK